jgi:hypothetical protein
MECYIFRYAAPVAALTLAAWGMTASMAFAQNPFFNLQDAQKEAKAARKDSALQYGDLRSTDIAQTLRNLDKALKLSGGQKTSTEALLQAQQQRIGALGSSLPTTERAIQAEGIYRYTENTLVDLLNAKQRLTFKMLYYSGGGSAEEARLRKIGTINQSLALSTPREALAKWQQFVVVTDEQRTALLNLFNTQQRELHNARRTTDKTESEIQQQTAMARAERQLDTLLSPEQRQKVAGLLLLPAPVDSPAAKAAAARAAQQQPTSVTTTTP